MFGQQLTSLNLFKGLDSKQVELLNSSWEFCNFPQNKVIFEQGQTTDFLYILTCGSVDVQFKPYDGPPMIVAHITPGGVFGWSAALGREAYTSSAIANEESQAFRISSVQLHKLCSQHPDTGILLLDRLAGAIAERLDTTHSQIFAILQQGIDIHNDCNRRINSHD
ncbi:MAG: cyclic nucleotide-binding domain-containing protein [Anaerolineaceae bacterium]|nr:cyclic nucleotide-binding domain-containing protein [Anaerolineaceae bacterium]